MVSKCSHSPIIGLHMTSSDYSIFCNLSRRLCLKVVFILLCKQIVMRQLAFFMEMTVLAMSIKRCKSLHGHWVVLTLGYLIDEHVHLFNFQKKSVLCLLIRSCSFIYFWKKFHPVRLLNPVCLLFQEKMSLFAVKL